MHEHDLVSKIAAGSASLLGAGVAAANEQPWLATLLAVCAAASPYLIRAFNAWLANRGKSQEEQIHAIILTVLTALADDDGKVDVQKAAARLGSLPTPPPARGLFGRR